MGDGDLIKDKLEYLPEHKEKLINLKIAGLKLN
jgi:hypothetical protein